MTTPFPLFNLPLELRQHIYQQSVTTLKAVIPGSDDSSIYLLPNSGSKRPSRISHGLRPDCAWLILNQQTSSEFRDHVLKKGIFFIFYNHITARPVEGMKPANSPPLAYLQHVQRVDLAYLWCNGPEDELTARRIRDLLSLLPSVRQLTIRIYHICYDNHYSAAVALMIPNSLRRREQFKPHANHLAEAVKSSSPELSRFILTYSVVQDHLGGIDGEPDLSKINAPALEFAPDALIREAKKGQTWSEDTAGEMWKVSNSCSKCRLEMPFEDLNFHCLEYCSHSIILYS